MTINPLHIKYPFTKGASQYIRNLNIKTDEFLTARIYEPARLLSIERVKNALEDPEQGVRIPQIGDERELRNALLSYVGARMVVSCIKDNFVITRYAIAEAKNAYENLKTENEDIILKFAEEFEIDVKKGETNYSIYFADYLFYSRNIREKDWSLLNSDMRNGHLTISKERVARLLQEAITMKIRSELPLPVTDEIVNAFKETINEIKHAVQQKYKKVNLEDFGELKIENLPPCIKKLLTDLQNGENLPHMARFALTAYLHNVGLDADEIIKIFSRTPDFNEKMTRYQVEHITGKTSHTEYTSPTCKTMKSYGICFNPDKLCSQEWMKHPLIYYRAKSKAK